MSVETTEIKKNLEKIRDLFGKSKDAQELSFYSKLAILELCGWIEESMDDIICGYAKKYLKNQSNLKSIEDVIKKTYGFDYKEHFRKRMLIQLIGLINTEKLETSFDQKIFAPMEAELSNLKIVRDKESHTYSNVTKNLAAPSATLNRLEPIYKGLEEIDNKLNNLS